jgi:hypothetical protein
MRFTLEQVLPGSIDDVLAALMDPEFLACLGDLPNLDKPEILDQTRDGAHVVQRVRYRFTGSLSPAVTRVIDPAKVTWVEETTYDLGARSATFRVVPDHYGGKLRCEGRYTFVEQPDGTLRRSEGDLVVKAPLVGRIVERAILSGLRDHFATEAALLAEWLEVKP